MSRFKTRITSPANRDALAAYSWLYKESPDAANVWYQELFEAISTLRDNPARCALAPEDILLDREIRQLLYGRYRILYTISEDTVVILRVRHSSQQNVGKID